MRTSRPTTPPTADDAATADEPATPDDTASDDATTPANDTERPSGDDA